MDLVGKAIESVISLLLTGWYTWFLGRFTL